MVPVQRTSDVALHRFCSACLCALLPDTMLLYQGCLCTACWVCQALCDVVSALHAPAKQWPLRSAISESLVTAFRLGAG